MLFKLNPFLFLIAMFSCACFPSQMRTQAIMADTMRHKLRSHHDTIVEARRIALQQALNTEGTESEVMEAVEREQRRFNGIAEIYDATTTAFDHWVETMLSVVDGQGEIDNVLEAHNAFQILYVQLKLKIFSVEIDEGRNDVRQ